jgi:hypothetical protein
MEIVSPAAWIAAQVTSLHPIRPPMIYCAHPVAARPGETLATCTQCKSTVTFAAGEAVDLRLLCAHDAPVSNTQDPAAIVAHNLARALQWWRWISGLEAAVWIMPWYVNVLANGEADPHLIKLGLRDDCEVVKRCDALINFGSRISSGMHLESCTMIEVARPVFQVLAPARDGRPPYQNPGTTPWRRWYPQPQAQGAKQ